MKIDFPDDAALRAAAEAAGFADAGDFVRNLVRQQLMKPASPPARGRTLAQRREGFRRLVDSLPASEVSHFDDSRESIY